MVHYYCQKRRWLLSQFQQRALSTITTMRSIYRRFTTTARKAAYPFRLSLLGVPEQVNSLVHSHTHTRSHTCYSAGQYPYSTVSRTRDILQVWSWSGLHYCAGGNWCNAEEVAQQWWETWHLLIVLQLFIDLAVKYNYRGWFGYHCHGWIHCWPSCRIQCAASGDLCRQSSNMGSVSTSRVSIQDYWGDVPAARLKHT